MNNTNSHYDDKICEAIEYIVDNAVKQAEYDRTIQATIVRTVDQTIGKFSVKYQDSIFYAYGSPDTKYSNGAEVYVLIPGNDTSREKTILGSTKKLGVNYINNPEGEDAFEVIGMNVLKNSSEFGLCSYNSEYTQIVYNREDNKNDIGLDIIAAETYIKQSSTILCGANIRTALPIEQQIRGNYGIIFELAFSNSSGDINTKNYVLDVNQMQGNPYRFLTESRQFGIFEIDGENFQYVNKIYFFVSNFPNKATDKPNDIFIKNLELSAVEKLSTEALSSYSLSFITPQGTYFDATHSDTETKSIQAQVRIKGKAIDKDSQKLDYYWFVENAAINYMNEKYNRYGGPGWECINTYTVIREAADPEPAVIEWNPASYELIVTKTDIAGKEKRYKCVAIYDDENIVSREITITNFSALYELSIESSEGTQFYFDIGSPTLTCKINGEERLEGYSYFWGRVDNVGTFTELVSTKDDMTIENNKVNNFYVGDIINFAIIKCSVKYGDTYLGTAEITLLNSMEKPDGDEESGPDYSLILHNGTQVFKYDESGLSPASGSLDEPQLILPLSFTIYNEMGQEVTETELASAEIQWIVPTENTMLQLTSVREPDIINKDSVIYKNDMTANYLIKDNYDIGKSNNTIILIIQYDGDILTATTNFTFIKEGEPGTNGTEYICKIIPNVGDQNIPLYPAIINGELNYKLPINDDGHWFKLQLWRNGVNIFEDYNSGDSLEMFPVELVWSVLKNKYTSDIYDASAITINPDTGLFSYNGYLSGNSAPANIIKCSVKYKDLYYYATLPLITGYTNNEDLSLQLKDYTGFRYAIYTTDGIKPRYDDREPFVIETTENPPKTELLGIGSIYGKIYNPESKQWEDNLNLEIEELEEQFLPFHQRRWTSTDETLSVSSNFLIIYDDSGLTLTNNKATSSGAWLNKSSFETPISGSTLETRQIIYMCVEAKGYSSNITGYPNMWYSIYENGGTSLINYRLNSTDGLSGLALNDDNWHTLSAWDETCNDSESSYCEFVSMIPVVYPCSTVGDKASFKNLKVYNLTEIFGRGNEPDKQWCDNNLAKSSYKWQKVKPKDKYTGECVTNAIEYVIYNSEENEIGKIHIPIHLMLNRYGNSAFNDWDGNSISINDNGGFILAPQVGAGAKNTDNTFTGILMGEVKEAGKSQEEIGLFGYSSGQRSIFLNAEDGSAIFGTAGDENGGQIIIKPGQKPVIESNNFKTGTDGKGLRIDFSSAPSIIFGSGKFSVNSEGILTATDGTFTGIINALEGGTIGGFTIKESYLYNGRGSLDSSADGVYIGTDGISVGTSSSKTVRLSKTGGLYARGADIGGNIDADSGEIGGWTLVDGSLSAGSTTLHQTNGLITNLITINGFLDGNVVTGTIGAMKGSTGSETTFNVGISSTGTNNSIILDSKKDIRLTTGSGEGIWLDAGSSGTVKYRSSGTNGDWADIGGGDGFARFG